MTMFESRLYQDILQEEVNALDCFASEDGSIWNGMMEDETFEEGKLPHRSEFSLKRAENHHCGTEWPTMNWADR